MLRVLEGLTRVRQKSLLVLTYHRIARPGLPANRFYDPVVSATPEEFEAQVAFLASRYQIISLQDLDSLDGGRGGRARKPHVLITFDDGYRDNYEVALPVLSRYDAPATFFVPTRNIENPSVPWWDEVAYLLKHTSVPCLSIDRYPGDPAPFVVNLGEKPTEHSRGMAITSTIASFLAGDIDEESSFLARLEQQAQVTVNHQLLGRELFMGWDELGCLVRAGMSIGSHGHSHRALARLVTSVQRQEIADSKQVLEAKLSRAVTAIAYPYGWEGTFSAETLELAGQAGYRWGFSSLEGINRCADLEGAPLCLRRLTLGIGDSALLLRARLGLYGSLGRSFV
jgi:peptidoglycan/xylan/chitin deacetylase (PgdA/CDA1 family)